MDQQPSPMAEAPGPGSDPQEKDIEENKDIAALSYVWVLSVFVLIYRRDSAFVRFHARQGTVLFLSTIAFWMLPPVIGRPLMLLVLAGCAAGFVSAAQGLRRELPLVYAISRGDPRLLRSSWRSVVQGVASLWHHVRNRAGKKNDSEAQSIANHSTPPTPTV